MKKGSINGSETCYDVWKGILLVVHEPSLGGAGYCDIIKSFIFLL